MKRVLPVFLAALIVPLWADEKTNKTPERIAAEYSSSVVLIVRELPAESIGLGTGFFVSPDVVVTNFHVIKGSNKVFLKLADGTILESDFLFGFDEGKDLALIKLPSTQEVQPIPLGDSDSVRQGESIVVISNPKGILENTVSNGLVSAIRKVSDKHTIFQISAPISPGSSGGPVFNSQGQAIGVVVATIKEGQNLNFAVPTDYVKQLLYNEVKSHYTLAWKTSSYSVPMYNQESGAVTGYWGHSDVRVTVYNPYSNTLLFTSSHHGRWRWSKPDKDAFKDAIEFMDRAASNK